MKKNAVAVADALAPPDFILNSVIGKSDGKVSQLHKYTGSDKLSITATNLSISQLYENIQHEFMTNPNAMERASWWKEVLPVPSKL